MNTASEAGPSTYQQPTPSDTAEVPAGFERWRRSVSQFTGLGLTDDEKERWNEERDYQKCEKWKKSLLTDSPMVIFMLKHLNLSSCTFPLSSIQCHPCPPTHAGGFSPDYGVLLCQNRFTNKKHMEDTLAHELIHAYDHCKFDVNWENLRHHACTEIRAANLSGDCNWTREIKRGFFGFSKQHQACVKRRAILSIVSNPSCKTPELAEQVVNEVWESCSTDTRPFDEIY